MEWSEAHDMQLCREIMVTNLFSAKRKTDRKRLWETIARNLVKINSPKFKTPLSERAVRERYMRIAQSLKTKINEEIKASGISPEQSELDVLLEELTEREEILECNGGASFRLGDTVPSPPSCAVRRLQLWRMH